jgi:hypothetical protein
MAYAKPEVVVSGSALNVIQSQVKGMYLVADSTGSSDHPPPTELMKQTSSRWPGRLLPKCPGYPSFGWTNARGEMARINTAPMRHAQGIPKYVILQSESESALVLWLFRSFFLRSSRQRSY